MFAPKVDKPRTKTTENPARRPGLERSPLPRKYFGFTPIEQTPFLQTAIRSQELPRPSAGQAPGSHREISLDNKATSAERRGLSCEFTRIPLYPPERASQAQPSFSPPATRFAGTIQTKLEVGSVDDPLEREADRVAEQVMRMPDAVAGASASRECGAISRMQRKRSCGGECSDCQKKSLKSEILQRASATIGPTGPMVVPPLVHKVLESPGQPLDAATRAFMEPRFGFDFSRIRVHADCTASESARSVDSLAYTVGPSIVFGHGHYEPHTDRGRRLLAHELTHTIQTGISRSNTAQGKILRQPGLTQLDGGHRRLIVIDANVIGEINRGNQAIADRLLELRSSATVLISQQAYQELTSQPGTAVGGIGPDLPRTAAANRQLLADMAIHVAPAGDPVRFREVIEANARARNTISNNDIQTAATARANDAELWSPDKSFRTQNKANLERVLRIRIANETYDSPLVGQGDREDYRVARRLLGLHEIDISVGGRTPLGPTGPPARSVSGTISTPPENTPASNGGGGGSAPSQKTAGQAAPPGQTSERVVDRAKAVEPSTTSSTTGDPIEPVNEAAHANQEAVGATEGALMMLHEKMFSNMQQAETDKAQRALDALTPKIEALRAEGKDVAVTMIVEKQVPNITHEVISEPGDLIRFIAVRIDANPYWVGSNPDLNLQAREEARFGTLDQQMKAPGDRFPMDAPPPQGWHYERLTQVFKSTKPKTDGTYRAVRVVGMMKGDRKLAISFGLERSLFVHHTDMKALDIEMRFGSLKAPRLEPDGRPPGPSIGPGPSDAPHSGKADADAFVNGASVALFASGRPDSWDGVFTRGTPGKPDSYRVNSKGTLMMEKGKAIILEVAEGEDLDPKWNFGEQSKWAALIRWERL